MTSPHTYHHCIISGGVSHDQNLGSWQSVNIYNRQSVLAISHPQLCLWPTCMEGGGGEEASDLNKSSLYFFLLIILWNGTAGALLVLDLSQPLTVLDLMFLAVLYSFQFSVPRFQWNLAANKFKSVINKIY